MNKREVIIQLKAQQTWSSKRVVEIVKGLSCTKASEAMSPTELRVGDMFYNSSIDHPCLIVEKRGEYFLVVGLTTAETGLTATKLESRYATDQYAYPSLQMTLAKGMEENYIGSVAEDEAKRVKIAVFDFIRNSQPQ